MHHILTTDFAYRLNLHANVTGLCVMRRARADIFGNRDGARCDARCTDS